MKQTLNRILILMLGWMAIPSIADVHVNIGLPVVQINLGVPAYPELIAIPGYPVYYAPGLHSNYFFYDGWYWVYEADDWYVSSWYNGPWARVDRYAIPEFILRIPVGYYRHAPRYFRGWQVDAPPRWDEHWGRTWQKSRKGWDQWDHRSSPKRPPLPDFQRAYSGDRYPSTVRQRELRAQHYHYQPRDRIVREHVEADRQYDGGRRNERGSSQLGSDSRRNKDNRKQQNEHGKDGQRKQGKDD